MKDGDDLDLNALIVLWRDGFAMVEEGRGVTMFMDFPAEWFEDPHWFCCNGHVSGRYLKSEEEGSLCLACQERVVLGPPLGEAEFAPILTGFRQALGLEAR